MAVKAKTHMRGYGRVHQRLRKAWDARVRTGTVRCARGANCLRAIGGIPDLIRPDEPWDLGHVEGDRHRYQGPEHRACNRGRAGVNKKKRRHSRVW